RDFPGRLLHAHQISKRWSEERSRLCSTFRPQSVSASLMKINRHETDGFWRGTSRNRSGLAKAHDEVSQPNRSKKHPFVAWSCFKKIAFTALSASARFWRYRQSVSV